MVAKKVRVSPYTKPTTGQKVRGYMRDDPRASVKGVPRELPREGESPSFLSGDAEPEEGEEPGESEESREGN